MEHGRYIADIDMSSWREKGTLAIDDTSYDVYREGMVSGDFILEDDGIEIAAAEKPSAFKRMFHVHYANQVFTLKAASVFRRAIAVYADGYQVGMMEPRGVFTRRTDVDLPEELPLPVRVFMIWLAVVLWQRESGSS